MYVLSEFPMVKEHAIHLRERPLKYRIYIGFTARTNITLTKSIYGIY